MNLQIKNFIYYLQKHCEIAGVGFDFTVKKKYRKVVELNGQNYTGKQYWLGCGFVVVLF